MGWMPAAEKRLTIQGLQAHAAHQRRDVPPPKGQALMPQEIAQHARSGKRILQIQRVNPSHQPELHL
jgi:hypothetical protein